MNAKLKSILIAVTFIFFALCLMGILWFLYCIDQLSGKIIAVIGIPAVICLAAAVYSLKNPSSVDRSYSNLFSEAPDKLKDIRDAVHIKYREQSVDMRIKSPDIRSLIEDPLFALDGKAIYKKVIAYCQTMGISEEELICDIKLGEVFKGVLSLICIGNKYTLYCNAVSGSVFLLYNNSIKKVSSFISEDKENGINIFFISLESENRVYNMRCLAYTENEVLHYYMTISRSLHHDCEISGFNN